LDAFAVYKRMVQSASALVDAHEIRFGADGGGMACRITMSAGIFLAAVKEVDCRSVFDHALALACRCRLGQMFLVISTS
jgi:hypothetical protein